MHPAGVSFETSLGLRAKVVQIFPVILDAKSLPIRSPGSQFKLVSVLSDQAKGYLLQSPSLDVSCHIWVPNGETILGEFVMQVRSRTERSLRVGIMLRVVPMQGTEGLQVRSSRNQPYLTAKLDELSIIALVSGLTEVVHKPHPGLVTIPDLSTKHDSHIRWVFQSSRTDQPSLQACMEWLKPDWKPVIKRSQLQQEQSLIHIRTGDSELDEGLLLSQVQSERMLMPVSGHVPFTAMLSSRQPDDLNPIIKQESALDRSVNIWEVYYACRNLLLPGRVNEAWGVVRNFIQLQRGDGHIDFQPTISGDWSHILAVPILATCMLDLHHVSPNPAALREAYPILKKYLGNWMGKEHDPDQDYLPIWKNSRQSGWTENPIFHVASGCPTWSIEAPALGALIYRELISVSKISREIGIAEDEKYFLEAAESVKQAVLECWDKRNKVFQYRDSDSHLTLKGVRISKGSGPGSFNIEREFEKPVRLHFSVKLSKDAVVRGELQIVGFKPGGEHAAERIPFTTSGWIDGVGSVSSKLLYSRVISIAVTGLTAKDSWQLSTPDLTQMDLSLFLPLWAGIPNKQTASLMVEHSLLPNWEESYPDGLGMLPGNVSGIKDHDRSNAVNTTLLCMIIDGLIDYAYEAEASRLVMNLMKAIIKNVRLTGFFQEAWDPLTLTPSGQLNHINGLPPVGLFLRAAGVEIIDQNHVAIWGTNHFDHELDIQYKDIRIHRGSRDAQISFRNEPPINISGVERKVIGWSRLSGGV